MHGKEDMSIGRKSKITTMPPEFHHIMAADASQEHVEPNFTQPLTKYYLSTPLCRIHSSKAKKTDLVWMMSKINEAITRLCQLERI